MKPKITNFNVNWHRIKGACMTTVGKEAGKEPGQDWKRKLLLCEHSPIRRSEISILFEEIPYYVSTHFVRHHVGLEKFISTSRSDRTGINRDERPQTEMVRMELDANIQALINISQKRLCLCSDKETVKYWKAFLEVLKEYDEDVYWACVPQCIRYAGCPEKFSDCKYFENFAKNLTKEELIDMNTRYDAYQKVRK